jgi:hypothetical protein
MTTSRNHYVPQWYQKRFLKDSKTRLYYLDLTPERTTLPTGERVGPPEVQRNSPKYCFSAQDLYTTTFFGIPNDEIERFLFGAIDNDGANAVRSVVDGDLAKIHEIFQRFFEYLDAQKLRTPRGLDWIKSRYPQLNQLELMVEMQQLRQMHCTMWLEAVREIVSAEDSDVKFIITDHPVTIYHPGFPPDSDDCVYPNDPDIALKGSQTLFPLGPNHCLILTNLEYARNPDRTDLSEPRQNARHFGRTIARIDAWIRARKLSRSDVTSINHILKSRARRFVAAAEEAWLYPEKVTSGDWRSNGKILLPPTNELWHFGGEIVVGYKDGTSDYQDAFGRTSRAHEYLRKDPPKGKPARGEFCNCGSGRTLEECCRDVAPEDRMPSNVYSIRERNLMFFRAIEDILGLSRGKTWEDVRRELSDDQVTKIHTAYAALWPKDTDLADLLPRPDGRVFRALYVGLIDPRTIAVSVLGWLRYFDEVILINPFVNAAFMKPEYSPIDSPGQYKEQTIKNVALLTALVPFIHDGVVHLVPDPLEFNDVLRQAIWGIAEQRRASMKPSPQDFLVARELGKDDFKRLLARLPDDSLQRQIRLSSPELSDEDLEGVIQYIRAEQAKDPLALIQPLVPGEEGAQLQQFRGINFELAMFLAQLAGAAVYSDQRLTKEDLRAARNPHVKAMQTDGQLTPDRELALRLTLDANPEETWKVRNMVPSEAFRASMRSLWKATLSHLESPNPTAVADALRQLEQLPEAEIGVSSESIQETSAEQSLGNLFNIDAELVIPPDGYGLNAVRRFLITFGRRKHIKAIPIAILFGAAALSVGTLQEMTRNECAENCGN